MLHFDFLTTLKAWYKGDLNAMFESIVSNPAFHSDYDIKVLSRPDYAEGDSAETVDYILGPWILTLDNFLSPAEAERLIELGQNMGYERSTDVGAIEPDGSVQRNLSTGRTSTNAWCLSEYPARQQRSDAAATVYRRTVLQCAPRLHSSRQSPNARGAHLDHLFVLE